jgi:glycosyltransferase involved in cell wall biosynthesis
MKVLILNDFGTLHGGAEIATLQLRDGLRRRGHQALVVSSAASPVGLPLAADVSYRELPLYPATYSQALNFAARKAVQHALSDFRPDVVHVGMFLSRLSPLILPLLRAIPSVHHVHWMRSVCMTGTKTLPGGSLCHRPPGLVCYQSGCVGFGEWMPWMLQMQLWRRWRNVFDRFVANCEATRAILVAEGFQNVYVIPNGVPERPRRPPLTNPPTALVAGRIDKAKGVDVLLGAWPAVVQAIPDAQLLIAGDGPERSELERTAPAGVSFLGHLSPDELERAAAHAWVHIVPSVGFENFPLVALEAMMRGTAVVASSIGGLPEIVQPEITGRLIAPGDREAWAAALIGLLGNRDLCEAMGAQARARAELLFSEEMCIDRFIRLYRDMMDGRCGEDRDRVGAETEERPSR